MAPTLSAASPPPASVPEPICRYLIAVDLSADMKPRLTNTRKTVAELFQGGISGVARTGDVIGLWTLRGADPVPNRGFKPQVWVPLLREEIASLADTHLQKQRPRGKTQLSTLVEALRAASTRSGVMTAILLTDGTKPVLGTPFDDKINPIFLRYGEEMKRSKRAFAVSLLARNGEWIAWAVSAGGGKIDVPFLPDEPAPNLPHQADALFNRLPLVLPPTQVAVPSPRPVQPSVVPTAAPASTPPVNSPLATQPAIPNVQPEPTPAPTQPATPSVPVSELREPIPATVTTSAAATPSAVATSPPVQEWQPPAPSLPTSPPQANPLAPAPVADATDTQAPLTTPSNPPPQAPAPLDPITQASLAPTRPIGLLMVALSLLAAAVGVAVLLVRSRRTPPEPSLISQSFDREHR